MSDVTTSATTSGVQEAQWVTDPVRYVSEPAGEVIYTITPNEPSTR
jgi:hypothetical protein